MRRRNRQRFGRPFFSHAREVIIASVLPDDSLKGRVSRARLSPPEKGAGIHARRRGSIVGTTYGAAFVTLIRTG